MSEPAGPSPQMGAVDHLMHRGEANPRTRSGVMLVEILDRTPDWTRVLDTFERASRVVPRLRQKAVVPSLPTASPRWVIDPDFDLLYHLRRVRAPEAGRPAHRPRHGRGDRLLTAGRGPATVDGDVGRGSRRRTVGAAVALQPRRHRRRRRCGDVHASLRQRAESGARADAAAARPGGSHPHRSDPLGHLPPAAEPDRRGGRRSDRCDPRRRQPRAGPDLDRRRRRRLRPLEHPRDGHAGRAVPTAATPWSVASHRGARHPAGPTACCREGQ